MTAVGGRKHWVQGRRGRDTVYGKEEEKGSGFRVRGSGFGEDWFCSFSWLGSFCSLGC